jgi:hypothetical protein
MSISTLRPSDCADSLDAMSDTRGQWTVETLKAYVDQRFADLEKRETEAKHSMERAEDQASATRRYTEEKSNEFRGQLSDQAAMFMPRSEADQQYSTNASKINEQQASAQRTMDDLRDTNQRSIDVHRSMMLKSVDELRDTSRRDSSELRGANQKSLDELRRLVYIATGIAIAAGIALPLLLHR